ncbi:MAG: glycoside hydrolase family 3 protein [Alphaproteobacteria bacterium]|nr:glycoside hydrolase family 3 protein [Alphaproteobacteria bacterium]
MSKPILAAILSCQGLRLTEDEKKLFSTCNPLGVTLFSRNLQNKKQIKSLTDEIKNVINRDDVLIGIDEEGGRVSRLGKVYNHFYVSAEILGKKPLKFSQMHATLIADDMLTVGINVNYAPVIDKNSAMPNTVLSGRCFGSDEIRIVKRAKLIADTYLKNGICPCIKHLPGHFDTIKDPHLELPEVKISKDDIKNKISYQLNFKNYPLAMTSHVLLSSFDKHLPVTISEKCVSEIIRGYLEFDGFLLSDAIDMHALKGTIREKAQKSWNAGLDAVCYCGAKAEDMYELCQEKRFLTEKSLIRFAKIKKIIHNTPKTKDISDLRQIYDSEFQKMSNEEYLYDATEVLHKMLEKGENV